MRVPNHDRVHQPDLIVKGPFGIEGTPAAFKAAAGSGIAATVIVFLPLVGMVRLIGLPLPAAALVALMVTAIVATFAAATVGTLVNRFIRYDSPLSYWIEVANAEWRTPTITPDNPALDGDVRTLKAPPAPASAPRSIIIAAPKENTPCPSVSAPASPPPSSLPATPSA